jgi:hypothetical protein
MSETGSSVDGEAPAELLIPADPVEGIYFALGVLDAVCLVAATLIGRGILEPDAFQDGVRKRRELWTEKGNPSRAAAAKVFGERLKEIERAKLKTNTHLVVLDNRAVN